MLLDKKELNSIKNAIFLLESSALQNVLLPPPPLLSLRQHAKRSTAMYI